MATPPRSCDTFVCLPPYTLNNCVVFGKNSDRPDDEVQEIVYQPKMVTKSGENDIVANLEAEHFDSKIFLL